MSTQAPSSSSCLGEAKNCGGLSFCGTKQHSLATSSGNQNMFLTGKRQRTSSSATQLDPTIDPWLVDALNQLSVKEREVLFEEIHGVGYDLPDKPQNEVDDCVAFLQKCIGGFSKAKRKAYDRALFLKPSLIHDISFYMLFLRSCRYDIPETAAKMCKYFDHKWRLFGDSLLARTITLADLEEGDLAVIRTGFHSIALDASGRKVMVADGRYLNYWQMRNFLRAIFFFSMTELTDEETQRKGYVNVLFFPELSPHALEKTMEMAPAAAGVYLSLPTRMGSVHVCFDDRRILPLLKLVQLASGREARMRFKTHCCSALEALYALRSFGIELNDTHHSQYCNEATRVGLMEQYLEKVQVREAEERDQVSERSLLEQHRVVGENEAPGQHEQNPDDKGNSNENVVTRLSPLPNDVLMGRGRHFGSFEGNLRLSEVSENVAMLHSSSSPWLVDLQVLSIDVVSRIKQAGGKFMKRTPNGWSEVSTTSAQVKVAQAFRNRKWTERQKQLNLNDSAGSHVDPAADRAQQPEDQNQFSNTLHGMLSLPHAPSSSSKRVRYENS